MPARWVSIQEYGAPGPIDERRLALIGEQGDSATAPLELVAMGSSDLVVIRLFEDLRRLAVANTTAAVSHQRCQGGAIVELAAHPLLRSPLEMLRPDPERPFYGVTSVKIDPFVNQLAGDRVAHALIHGVVSLVHDQFRDFDRDAIEWARPFLEAKAGAMTEPDLPYPLEAGPDLGGLQLWPIAGLDAAELIIVARSPRLEWLARLPWALRRLRGTNLPECFSGIEHDDEVRRAIAGVTERRMQAMPLVVYTMTTVGVPRPILDAPPADAHRRLACKQGALTLRFSDLPDGPASTDALLEQIGRDLGSGRPRRATVFGGHDQVVRLRAGSVDPAIGAVRDAPLFGPVYWHHVFRALSLAPSGPAEGLRWETSIECESFPPGHGKPDEIAPVVDHPREASPQTWFDGKLSAARAAWVEDADDGGEGNDPARRDDGHAGHSRATSLYHRLKMAAVEAQATYPSTHAILSMVLSIVTKIVNRREVESYLDLVAPLHALVRDWIETAPGEPAEMERTALRRQFNNLDRVLHARAHRDSPHHRPAVSRAFEARAGYTVPRDSFIAYLGELVRRRVQAPAVPLVVDGVEPSLRVKLASSTAIFSVSALRLHQPVLWPVIVHEVEHVRLLFDEVDASVVELAQELFRDPPKTALVVPRDRRRRTGPHRNQNLTTCYALLSALARHAKSVPGRKTTLLVDAVGSRGHQHPMVDGSREEPSCALAEVVCDLAVMDSGALAAAGEQLDDDELVGRFLFTLIPSWIMDLRAQWSNSLAPTLAEEWARQAGARLAAVLALAPLTPGADDVEIQQRLEYVLTTDTPTARLWHDVTVHLLYESWGRRSGHGGVSNGIELDAATAIVRKVRDQLVELTRHQEGERPSWWARFLQVGHRVRALGARPAAAGPHADPLEVVAAHLRDVRAAHREAGVGQPYPQIYSRGGLHADGVAALAANERLFDLYAALRPAVRATRLRAIGLFFSPMP